MAKAKKDSAAVEAALSASIVESFKVDIAEVQNDMERQGVAFSISKAREEGHISEKQEKELLAMLGVEPPQTTPFTMDDAVAFNAFLQDQNEALHKAELDVARLKDELKEAKKIVKQLEAMILSVSARGAKDFKAKNRTLFDDLEEA